MHRALLALFATSRSAVATCTGPVVWVQRKENLVFALRSSGLWNLTVPTRLVALVLVTIGRLPRLVLPGKSIATVAVTSPSTLIVICTHVWDVFRLQYVSISRPVIK